MSYTASRKSGEDVNKQKSWCKPGLGPGEKNLIPVAPGPRAVNKFTNALPIPINTFMDFSFIENRIEILIFAAFLFFCLNAKVKAVPVFEKNIEIESAFCNNLIEGTNSYTDYSILNRYPWWINRGVSDAVNVEWTAAQDFKYQAVERVLYNFLGGSYEPGSRGCPFTPRHKFLIIVQPDNDEIKVSDVLPGSIGNKHITGDIISYRAFYTEIIQNNYTGFNRPDNARYNMNAVPEPSSIIVFTFLAMGYLWMKKRNG